MPPYSSVLQALLRNHLNIAIQYRVRFDPPNDAHEQLISALRVAAYDIDHAEDILNDINEALKTAPNKTQRIYAKALTDIHMRPAPIPHPLTRSLGAHTRYLPIERRTADDFSTIHHPNEYITARNELHRPRFSSFWFFNKTEALLKNESMRVFFKVSGDEIYGLSEAGTKRAQELIETALNFDRPHELTDTILQSDLVILGHFFGRHKVKQILDRYGIYADGTKEHPFQYFHFAALLMGISACDSPQDSLYWNEQHKQDYQKALSDIRYAISFGLGAGDEFMLQFARKAQNPIPDTIGVSDQFSDILWRNANQTSNTMMSQNALLFAAGGNPLTAAALQSYGLSDGIERIFRPDNACYLNYMYDWARTFELSCSDNIFSEKSRTALVEAVVNTLRASDNLEDFSRKHRVFNERSLSKNEYAILEKYFTDKRKSGCDSAPAVALAMRITHTMISTARQEYMTHVIAYLRTYNNNQFIYNLYTHDFKKRPFQAQGVIKDEAGMAVTLFTPALEHDSDFETDDEIPLYITSPGTHDEMSAVRDLFLISPGLHDHAPTKPFRQRYISALNEQIIKLKARFPSKRIRIEIFGHSLGGADAKNIELSILEALGQNLQAKSPEKIVDYKQAIYNEIQNNDEDNEWLKRSFNLSLSSGLGNRRRHFNARFKDAEDRRYNPQDIHALTVDNIGMVSRSSDRSTGEIEEIAQSRAALIGLLSHQGVRFNEHDQDVEGCIVKLSGEKHAAYYFDPTNKALFNANNITARHITAITGMGMSNFGWLKAYLLGKYAAIDAHMGAFFYKPHPVKSTFNAFDLGADSTAKDVKAYRKQVEEPHRIGDRPVTRIMKALVVIFRYFALAFAFFLRAAAVVIKAVRETFHRLLFIEGYDVPSEGLRPAIDHRRKMLNEKWSERLPGELHKEEPLPLPYSLKDRQEAVKDTLLNFYKACTPDNIGMGAWSLAAMHPDGLETMHQLKDSDDYLIKVQSIGEHKRSSTLLTRQFHAYIRSRDPFIERFYQRCAEYQPNNTDPHYHEGFRRRINGLTVEMKCRKY